MDQDQINQLGSKMRGIYDDVSHEEPAAPARPVSRRLRKAPGFAKANARRKASAGDAGSFIAERPITALLVAAGVGYVLSRLTRH